MIDKLLKGTRILPTLIEQGACIVLIANTEGVIEYVNHQFCKITGYTAEDIIGKNTRILKSGRTLTAEYQQLWETITSGNQWRGEFCNKKKNGEYFWVFTSISPVKNETGLITHFIAVQDDVTEQKKTKKSLDTQYAVTQVLSESVTMSRAFPKILRIIGESQGWSFGVLWIAGQPDNVLRRAEVWHTSSGKFLQSEAYAGQTTLLPGIELPGRVWSQAKPLWTTDFTHELNSPRLLIAYQEGLRAAIGFPITYINTQSGTRETKVLGIIEFFSQRGQEPDKDLLHMMHAIGNQIGMFIILKQAERQIRNSHEKITHSPGAEEGIIESNAFTQRFEAYEARFREIVHENIDGIMVVDRNGKIVFTNSAAQSFLLYNEKEFMNEVSSLPAASGEKMEIDILRSSGEKGIAEMRIIGTKWEGKRARILSITDITDRKRTEETIQRMAYHDHLTGLPNQILFNDRLTMALSYTQRRRELLAVLYLDLDEFKSINDTLGHAAGDLLLKTVTDRLIKHIRKSDTITRLGGDEFALLLMGITRIEDVVNFAVKIIDIIREPLALAGHDISITTSVGIAIYPTDGNNAETLLRNADTAMYYAKSLGKNTYHIYTTDMHLRTSKRITLEQRLRKALERGEFILYYQPQIDLSTGHISGAEALIRWQHPEHGLLMPREFIHLAEETELIVPISEWVLKTACKQNKLWQDAGAPPLRIAVNLSPLTFRQKDLYEKVAGIVKEAHLIYPCLELEITESVAMRDIEYTVAMLQKLNGSGITVAIDDFGMDYSALNYLKRLMVQRLKIGQSFVRGIVTDANDAATVTTIINMAKGLGIKVIAECVETQEQLMFLKKKQCHEIQGFLISEPLPGKEFEKIILKRYYRLKDDP